MRHDQPAPRIVLPKRQRELASIRCARLVSESADDVADVSIYCVRDGAKKQWTTGATIGFLDGGAAADHRIAGRQHKAVLGKKPRQCGCVLGAPRRFVIGEDSRQVGRKLDASTTVL